MQLKNYIMYENRVELLTKDDSIHPFYLNQRSGKVYFRYKIGTMSDIKHVGIYFGQDVYGNNYYLHNHYKTGVPAIVSEAEFLQGQVLYAHDSTALNSPTKTLARALQQVMERKPYDWINYNCQTFVNTASMNLPKSEDVEKWAGGLALAALLFIGIRVFKN